jgi:hypothetical protein
MNLRALGNTASEGCSGNIGNLNFRKVRGTLDPGPRRPRRGWNADSIAGEGQWKLHDGGCISPRDDWLRLDHRERHESGCGGVVNGIGRGEGDRQRIRTN